MKKWMVVKIFLCVAFILIGAGPALAIPSLQLDIAGGVYDPVNQTVVATSNPFTLYAYLIPDSFTPLAGTYYVSAALLPSTSAPGDLGSFVFDGTSHNVTADLIFGTPPADAALDDLASHGVFQTYYREFAFTFDSANKAIPYEMNANPGSSPTPVPLGYTGTIMYYESFDVSTLLASGYQLHFDLYYPTTAANGKPVTYFAPFSHDASSQVPIPAAAWLLGSGLLGLVAVRRRFRK